MIEIIIRGAQGTGKTKMFNLLLDVLEEQGFVLKNDGTEKPGAIFDAPEGSRHTSCVVVMTEQAERGKQTPPFATVIKEGSVKRNGSNEPPDYPKPNVHPSGQRNGC